MAFNDVYSASEIIVSIAEWDGAGSQWNYTPVAYRRNFNVNKPDNTRKVYDGLSFKGSKKGRSENTLSIEQEFQGFDKGLFPLENQSALLVKAEIVPHEGSLPTDNVRYYLNWCPGPISWSAGEDGAFNITLEGAFDKEVTTEPADNTFSV